MGEEIPCISPSLAKTYIFRCVLLCLSMSFNRSQVVFLYCYFSFCNVGPVVKSAFMRYCDVVSWYVAILDVIYQCASLSLFSWFEFKIKQAVTCAECVCQSRLLLCPFSAHTAPNAALRQCGVNDSDGFSYRTLYYSDVHTLTQIHTTIDMYFSVHV